MRTVLRPFGVTTDAELVLAFVDDTAMRELNRRYRIGGVPSLIINGKYTTEGGQTASYDELVELANALAAAEHAGK